MKKFIPIIFIFLVVILFFKDFFLKGYLPIPSDTIVGLYNPYRDFYAKNYPNGIPFKNFLITDPVRQTYPWRNLVINLEKKLELPLWNPYNFAGTPLLANFQSAPFYPLNILFFVLPFSISWSLLIVLEPLLVGIFLYFYLRNLKLNIFACLLGSITFAFCGFFTSWMEWNTITQTILWFPLILLAKDKLINKWTSRWAFVFFFAECAAMLAGHLQTLFYLLSVTNAYLFIKIFQKTKIENKHNFVIIYFKKYFPFLLVGLLMFLVTSIQWVPTLQFINLSSRSVDQTWTQTGWFIPYQNLIQFIFPDFFGNPTTLNYFGIWNYAEFVGYIGIIPLILALFALIFRHDKKTYFWSILSLICFVFALENPISKLPFQFSLPFLSEAQPTRLLSIIDFSLSILSALGLDYFLKNKNKKILFIFGILFVIIIIGWLIGLNKIHIDLNIENIATIKRNLVLPTVIFSLALITALFYLIFKNKKYSTSIFASILILITVFDLLRFADKFTPFTSPNYLYPSTKVTEFLQKNLGNYRYMTTDSRILPPNFSIMYNLQSVDGYDPLYLNNYAQLIIASERNKSDISSPYGFNRIITPHNYNSKIMNLLGVKYIISLESLNNTNFKEVYREGETVVNENKNYLPRAFFVSNVIKIKDNKDAINNIFKSSFNPKISATVMGLDSKNYNLGLANITSYTANEIVINTQNKKDGFLILTDSFYPTWHAYVDGKETKIYLTDLDFRGISVPKGEHTITFKDQLF